MVCDYLEALEPRITSEFYDMHWDAALAFTEAEHAKRSN